MSFYNRISQGYNELHEEEQIKKLNLIKSNLKLKNPLILDVGCGTGLSSGFFDNIIGVDPSLEMLEQAEFPVVHGIAEDLPFKDKSFDLVICVTAAHNFDDVKKGLKEIKRVGKKYVITILKKSSKYDEIYSLIKNLFEIEKAIVEEKDVILFLK